MPVTDTSNERRGKRGETPPPLPSLRSLARKARESAPPPERAPRDRAPDLAIVSTTPLADPGYDLVPMSQPAPDSVPPTVSEPTPEPKPSVPVVLLSRAVVACAATFAFGAVTMFAASHWLARPARAAEAPAAAVEAPPVMAPPAAAADAAVEAQPAPATKAHASVVAPPFQAVHAEAAPPAAAAPAAAAPANAAPADATPDTAATTDAEAAFDQQAARAAIDSAAGTAAACGDGSGTYRGRVVMTFAPSGRVTQARVEGDALAGTAIGGCVAGAMRAARVPRFAGPAVTVQKSVVVR